MSDEEAGATKRLLEDELRVRLEEYRVRVNEKIEQDREDFERRWEQISEALRGSDGDIVLALLARTLDALEVMGFPQQWALLMLNLRAGQAIAVLPESDDDAQEPS